MFDFFRKNTILKVSQIPNYLCFVRMVQHICKYDSCSAIVSLRHAQNAVHCSYFFALIICKCAAMHADKILLSNAFIPPQI